MVLVGGVSPNLRGCRRSAGIIAVATLLCIWAAAPDEQAGVGMGERRAVEEGREADEPPTKLERSAWASGDIPEAAPGLGSTPDRVISAWPGDPAVEAYADALIHSWRVGPLEFSPSAEHIAVYAPCDVIGPANLPKGAGSRAGSDPGLLGLESRVTRGRGEHAADCALDIMRKPARVTAVELAGRIYPDR